MSKNDHDFGFTFHDESEINDQIKKQVSATEQTYASKLSRVQAIIIPFMENMMQDPEKVMIRWPNRAEVVEKQLKKILSIIEE